MINKLLNLLGFNKSKTTCDHPKNCNSETAKTCTNENCCQKDQIKEREKADNPSVSQIWSQENDNWNL